MTAPHGARQSDGLVADQDVPDRFAAVANGPGEGRPPLLPCDGSAWSIKGCCACSGVRSGRFNRIDHHPVYFDEGLAVDALSEVAKRKSKQDYVVGQ